MPADSTTRLCADCVASAHATPTAPPAGPDSTGDWRHIFSDDGTDEETTVADRDPRAATAARTAPRAFAGYELFEQIGSGGMGVVFRARQVRADRIVALKVIKGDFGGEGELRDRFRTEAQALARVKHPNIVQIYDVGEERGYPYFSMEYVPGGSLAQRLKREPIPVREAAQLTEALARAVEAAHQAGVLHRDLKPSNILLDADGTPRITDFGLAKQLEKDDGHTRSGAMLGTPGYMAPEQARGQLARIGKTTDVYGLGATLYDLLTRSPPFHGDTSAATVQLVLTAEPTPPSRRQKCIPAELEAICLKCLEKEPARRYPTAAALADDVGRFLRGENTVARPLRWPTKLWRALRRRRAAVAVVALLLASMMVTAVVVDLMRSNGHEVPPDPDAALHDMERDLAAGKAVTLVGETGPPRWFRPLHGGGAATEPGMSDGVFAFQSLDEALIELLPDPHLERYKFTAEVRHDKRSAEAFKGAPGKGAPGSESVGGVGVYFGYHPYAFPTRDRAYHGLRLEFADDGPPPDRPELPWRSAVRLIAFLNLLPFERGEQFEDIYQGSRPFVPVKLRPGPWRKLEIEVRPDSVRAFWWDEKTQKLQPVAQLDATGLKALTQSSQQSADKLNALAGMGLTVQQFNPRSGLGLYAARGKASFRNVTIEPLQSDP
jgi:Protein kinase domain